MEKNVDNQKIDEIKTIITSRKMKTNCFSFYNEILDWIENNQAEVYIIQGNLFLFLNTHGFYKLYYYVNSFNDIALCKELLEKYQNKTSISLEFTTKNAMYIDEITPVLQKMGFCFYKEYARVLSAFSPFTSDEEEVLYDLASLNNKNELLEIMYKEFDIISDYLPTEEELIKLIHDQSILIKILDGKIVFIQIYEYSKGALYSRMTWIDKKYRKPKYTIDFYKSLDSYLKQLKIKNSNKIRFYGWVDKNNKNFKINLKFGGQLDGVTCTIFLYNNEKDK